MCPILMATDEFTSHKTKQVFKMKFVASYKSFNIVYLITCKRHSRQYVGETGQLLHRRINEHHFNIAHRKTEESPVAEHFSGQGRTLADRTVEEINQLYSHDPCLRKITGKQVDQNAGDFTSFWNEPECGFPAKSAR